MNLSVRLCGVVLCFVSMVSATPSCDTDTVPSFASSEQQAHICQVVTQAASLVADREKSEPEKSSVVWRYLLCAVALCGALYWWQRHKSGPKKPSMPPMTLTIALQDRNELAAWFEAGVRAQAVHEAGVPVMCADFLHGVDRCARAPGVTLPPLLQPRGDIPAHFHNAIIARFVQKKELATKEKEASFLTKQQGVRGQQCSILRFCKLVEMHIPRAADKEKAGTACADALLLLVARLRHGSDIAAAREELQTWLEQQYPLRARGYTPEQRCTFLARLAKETV